MPNYSSATLVGHLGRNPELKSLPSGDAVCTFNIATTRKSKNGDVTTWWKCTAWGRQGENIAKYFTKGDPILVTGEPFQSEWTDKEGNKRLTLELNVQQFTFIRGARDTAETESPAPVSYKPTSSSPAQDYSSNEEDIPF